MLGRCVQRSLPRLTQCSVRRWQGPASKDDELGEIWTKFYEKEAFKNPRKPPERLTPMNPYARPDDDPVNERQLRRSERPDSKYQKSGHQQQSEKKHRQTPRSSNDHGPTDSDSPKVPLDFDGVEEQMENEIPSEELTMFGIDKQNLRKLVPGGDASHSEIVTAMMEENIEWGGIHWSERNYTAKHGDIVLRNRPPEVQRMLEQSAENVYKLPHLGKCKPVTAGGPAYPIFYDPKKGVDRPHANIPSGAEAKKARVLQIQSLVKLTGLSYSKVALVFDYAQGEYSVTLETLRKEQVDELAELTGNSRDVCEKTFNKCLGNYHKALKQLSRDHAS